MTDTTTDQTIKPEKSKEGVKIHKPKELESKPKFESLKFKETEFSSKEDMNTYKNRCIESHKKLQGLYEQLLEKENEIQQREIKVTKRERDAEKEGKRLMSMKLEIRNMISKYDMDRQEIARLQSVQ